MLNGVGSEKAVDGVGGQEGGRDRGNALEGTIGAKDWGNAGIIGGRTDDSCRVSVAKVASSAGSLLSALKVLSSVSPDPHRFRDGSCTPRCILVERMSCDTEADGITPIGWSTDIL